MLKAAIPQYMSFASHRDRSMYPLININAKDEAPTACTVRASDATDNPTTK